MKIKNCGDRKLDASDCKPSKKNPGWPSWTNNRTQAFIILDETTQGYFLSGNGRLGQRDQINIERFGLPEQRAIDFDLKMIFADRQKSSRCCDSEQMIQIVNSGKEYISPLHKVTDTSVAIKDLEEILKIQKYTIFFGYVENLDKELQTRVLKGFVKIDLRRSGPVPTVGMTFAIWEFRPETGEKHIMLVVQRFFGNFLDDHSEKVGDHSEKGVRNYFENLKNSLTGLYYSQKTKDVLGGFD